MHSKTATVTAKNQGQGSKVDAPKYAPSSGLDAVPSDSDSDIRQADEGKPPAQSASVGKASSRLSSLFSMAYSTTSHSKPNSRAPDAAEKADNNTTAEAMEGDKAGDNGKAEPELTELILIVHGVGQKVKPSVAHESRS